MEQEMVFLRRGTAHKAESLIINNVGQRPMKQNADKMKPRRGGINSISML